MAEIDKAYLYSKATLCPIYSYIYFITVHTYFISSYSGRLLLSLYLSRHEELITRDFKKTVPLSRRDKGK